jgi:hypothetical protein
MFRNAIQTARRTGERGNGYRPKIGIAFVHTVIDDHSRMAYAEIQHDEKAVTAIGVLQRAVAWFTERGVTVERVLSDNGAAYRSFAWRDACAELRITHKRTRPYRPKPTARSSDSTAPWATAGPTHGSMSQPNNATSHYRDGCTSTITTDHGALGLHTPADIHYGTAEAVRDKRAAVLIDAYRAHPERFSRKPPQPPHLPTGSWINPPDKSEETTQ